MYRTAFNRIVIALLIAGFLCIGDLHAAAVFSSTRVRAAAAGRDQQPDPRKKELSVTVLRSAENETITLNAYFPEDANSVKVALYNILGKLVEQLPLVPVTKGDQSFRFQTHGLPNGPYIVVLEANNQRVVNKVMISR